MTVEWMKYKSVYFVLAIRANCEGVVAGTFPSAMTACSLCHADLPLVADVSLRFMGQESTKVHNVTKVHCCLMPNCSNF